MKPKSSNLGMAYNMSKMGKKMGGGSCPDCMSMGGKCMAHGGEVENEKMHPEMEVEMPEGMETDLDAMKEEDDESEDAKYAHGGPVHTSESIAGQIMKDRKMSKYAKGGMVTEPVENDFEKRVNLEPVHTMEDDEHGVESPSLDDEALVGQILRERKMRRR